MKKSKSFLDKFLTIYNASVFIITHFVFYEAMEQTDESNSIKILAWLVITYFLPIAYFFVIESNSKQFYIWKKETFNDFGESLERVWFVIYNKTEKYLTPKESVDKVELSHLLTKNNESFWKLKKNENDKSEYLRSIFNLAGFYYTAIIITVATFCF